MPSAQGPEDMPLPDGELITSPDGEPVREHRLNSPGNEVQKASAIDRGCEWGPLGLGDDSDADSVPESLPAIYKSSAPALKQPASRRVRAANDNRQDAMTRDGSVQ